MLLSLCTDRHPCLIALLFMLQGIAIYDVIGRNELHFSSTNPSGAYKIQDAVIFSAAFTSSDDIFALVDISLFWPATYR